MSICYEIVTEWTDIYNLIVNRVSVINQQLGYGVDGLLCNPIRLVANMGNYTVLVGGVEYATFRVYDLKTTSIAFDRIDSLNDGLWYLFRCSIISQPTII